MTPKNIAIGVLILIVVLLAFLLGRQRKDNTGTIAAANEHIDKANHTLDSLRDTVQAFVDRAMVERATADSVTGVFQRENSALKHRLSRIKPTVLKIIEKDTTLQQAWELQDLIIESDSGEIARLNLQVAKERGFTDQLMQSEAVEDRLHGELIGHKDVVIDLQGKEIKRLKRVMALERIGGAVLIALIVIVAK